MRGINFEIDGLEEPMQDMAKKMKEAKKKRDVLEGDLVELGFNVESLRGLQKNHSKESYDPAGDKAEAIPEYVPTPHEKEQKPQEQQKEVEEEETEKEKQKDEEAMFVDLTDPESTAKLLNTPVEEGGQPNTCIIEQLGMNPDIFWKFVAPILPTQPGSVEVMEMEETPQPVQPSTSQIPTLPSLPTFPTTPAFEPLQSAAAAATAPPENVEVSSGIPIMDVSIEQALKSIFKENDCCVCPFVAC